MNVNTGFQNQCLILASPVVPASVFYLRWWQNDDSSQKAPLALFVAASLSQAAGQTSECHTPLQTGKNERTRAGHQHRCTQMHTGEKGTLQSELQAFTSFTELGT